MSIIVWDQSYTVQISEIDNQHKYFFETLDMLYEAINTLRARDSIDDIFKRLIDYSNYHFSTEEKYFQEFHYEEAEAHIKAHQEFREKLNHYYQNFSENKLQMTIDLEDFLENWLVLHINSMDKRYTKCFLQHGLK